MIRNTRWFLFIEWWVGVIAIVGVLSAALFPSMTGYLQRSRDAARMSHIKDISTSLGAYYSDTEKYPETDPSGCIPDIGPMYFPKGTPKDPTSSGRLSSGCDGSNGGTYVYRVGSGTLYPTFFVAADMENIHGWNSDIPLPDLLDRYPADEIQSMLVRWSGPYYILSY
jgi:type II secretory pathway pseudopilin PulG